MLLFAAVATSHRTGFVVLDSADFAATVLTYEGFRFVIKVWQTAKLRPKIRRIICRAYRAASTFNGLHVLGKAGFTRAAVTFEGFRFVTKAW